MAQALMRELLGEAGYHVSTLTRVGQSLETIVEIAPDLIVIDYMWPSSDNEWTLLNLLTMDRRIRSVPLILCTSAVRHVQEMSDHLRLVGVRVVYKPFHIDSLLAEVEQALRGKAVPLDAIPPKKE